MTKLYEVEMNSQGMPNFSTAKEVAELKKGKWIWCGNHHICSECDEWSLTRWDEDKCDEVDILTDFCPNCGADMRRECNE